MNGMGMRQPGSMWYAPGSPYLYEPTQQLFGLGQTDSTRNWMVLSAVAGVGILGWFLLRRKR
jgi:LPXTG-motif cell wall-anchored protein